MITLNVDYLEPEQEPEPEPLSNVKWSQIAVIEGKAKYDVSGWSVAMNGDGTRIAIGAPYNDDTGYNDGHVRVYDFNGSTWNKVGGNINDLIDYAVGSTVAISKDGTRIAIGAGFSGKGARVYERDISNTIYSPIGWKVVGVSDSSTGATIDGETTDDKSGWSVAMNGNGTIIAIGAPYNEETLSSGSSFESGHVRVYQHREYTQNDEDNNIYHYGTTELGSTNLKPLIITGDNTIAPAVGYSYWTQLGWDINGKFIDNDVGHFGRSIAMSNDGTRIAIGGINIRGQLYPNQSQVYNKGYVRVYDYRVYTQNDKNKDTYHYRTSSSIYRPLISTPNTSTAPVVGNSYWSQVGRDIDGQLNDYFGHSVAMNSSGTRIVIGGRGKKEESNESNNLPENNHSTDGQYSSSEGVVRVYDWDGSSWIQVGDDIKGESTGDQSGWSVAMDAIGNRIAIGAPYNSSTGNTSATIILPQDMMLGMCEFMIGMVLHGIK